MPFHLDSLPYEYAALEPFLDEQTMRLHHDKHHQTYVDKLNAVVEKYPELSTLSIEELLRGWSTLTIPEADKVAIKNHGGGHMNHTFFWSIMGPQKAIDTALVAEIEQRWTIEELKKSFSESAAAIFGSGWMWLVRKNDGTLDMYATGQQDSPHMKGHTPLIGLDVWEHAYYLKYQNRRADYIAAWWNVLKLLP